ncbi:hypothetical protein GCM10010236_36560 [Streptomyces eurythermus]|nr:hypothetical protein GCM10010236_36560 [Streptomyces eurythermus]
MSGASAAVLRIGGRHGLPARAGVGSGRAHGDATHREARYEHDCGDDQKQLLPHGPSPEYNACTDPGYAGKAHDRRMA